MIITKIVNNAISISFEPVRYPPQKNVNPNEFTLDEKHLNTIFDISNKQ